MLTGSNGVAVHALWEMPASSVCILVYGMTSQLQIFISHGFSWGKMTALSICLMQVKWFEDENCYLSAEYCYWSLRFTCHGTSDSSLLAWKLFSSGKG